MRKVMNKRSIEQLISKKLNKKIKERTKCLEK